MIAKGSVGTAYDVDVTNPEAEGPGSLPTRIRWFESTDATEVFGIDREAFAFSGSMSGVLWTSVESFRPTSTGRLISAIAVGNQHLSGGFVQHLSAFEASQLGRGQTLLHVPFFPFPESVCLACATEFPLGRLAIESSDKGADRLFAQFAESRVDLADRFDPSVQQALLDVSTVWISATVPASLRDELSPVLVGMAPDARTVRAVLSDDGFALRGIAKSKLAAPVCRWNVTKGSCRCPGRRVTMRRRASFSRRDGAVESGPSDALRKLAVGRSARRRSRA